MAWTYEDVIPTLIPNTTMQKSIDEQGVHRVYRIRAVDGFVLHDINYDTFREETVIDPETGEESMNPIPVLGYHTEVVTCSARYEFTPVEMQDDEGNTHIAYGSRQFFTRPFEDVPADQIFGVGTETEIM